MTNYNLFFRNNWLMISEKNTRKIFYITIYLLIKLFPLPIHYLNFKINIILLSNFSLNKKYLLISFFTKSNNFDKINTNTKKFWKIIYIREECRNNKIQFKNISMTQQFINSFIKINLFINNNLQIWWNRNKASSQEKFSNIKLQIWIKKFKC